MNMQDYRVIDIQDETTGERTFTIVALDESPLPEILQGSFYHPAEPRARIRTHVRAQRDLA